MGGNDKMTGTKELGINDIIFREDLYPRLEKNPTLVQRYAKNVKVIWRGNIPCLYSNNLWIGYFSDGMFYFSNHETKFCERIYEEWSKTVHEECSDAMSQTIYFIQSEKGAPVKIGITTDTEKRLAALQTAHPFPLKIIKLIPNASKEMEKEIHKRFKNQRLNGEWFEYTKDLEEFING